MISDLTNLSGNGGHDAVIVPHGNMGSDLVIEAIGSNVTLALVQPIHDVPGYLAERAPQPSPVGEENLLATLPATLQNEINALVRACELVLSLVKKKTAVQPACERALRIHAKRNWHLKTFRAKYDEWSAKRDWVVLVNCSKAPVAWRKGNGGLPSDFITFCAKRFAAFKRDDGKRQALLSVKRQWLTGRNDFGVAEVIPGYAEEWDTRQREIFPIGWHYSNILRQMKKRAAFTKAVQAMTHQGSAMARKSLPEVKATRTSLRFMEVVEFDDVKVDFRVIDTASGQVNDLWLLIARDKATGMLLGFGMRPARMRDDDTQEHLKLRDMKQLVGWLLETYGLPPYKMTFKIEHGTATLSQGTSAALRELLGEDRIVVSYSSMLGGPNAVSGYAESRIGNSQGKASLESHNRLGHTIAANLPGQTGPLYTKRPTDLLAREKEATDIWELAQHLPENLRGQAKYPLLTVQQAREHLFRIFSIENHRTEHAMEGFERIAEWFDGQSWKPQNTAPDGEVKARVRMEKPIERAARLCAGIKFSRVAPQVITTFYEHTQRPFIIQDNGEIEFTHEGKKLYFRNPDSGRDAVTTLAPGVKGVAYFHPDEPRFVHLTSGDGRILGTWLRRALVNDPASLAEAIRYSTTALNQVKEYAQSLGTEEREQLEAMRTQNAELMRFADFVDVGHDAVPTVRGGSNAITGPVVGKVLANTSRAVKQAIKQKNKAEQDFVNTVGAAAAADIFKRSDPDRE